MSHLLQLLTSILYCHHNSPKHHGCGCGRGEAKVSPLVNLLIRAVIYSFPRSTTCQVCNKPSHVAVDCYHHLNMSNQGRNPSCQLAANAPYC